VRGAGYPKLFKKNGVTSTTKPALGNGVGWEGEGFGGQRGNANVCAQPKVTSSKNWEINKGRAHRVTGGNRLKKKRVS